MNAESDEDSGEVDADGLVDNLNSHQLQASAEAVLQNGRAINGYEQDDSDTEENVEVTSHSKKKVSQKNSLSYNWRKRGKIKFAVHPAKETEKSSSAALKGKSPLEKFEFFFDEAILNMIANESRRYAREKNVEYTILIKEFQVVLGILLLSGYHPLPSQ